MKKHKNKIVGGLLVLLIGLGAWFLFYKSTEPLEWTGGRIIAENWQSYVKQVGKEKAVKTYVARLMKNPFMDESIPIRFYGKIIDQFGEPIEDAEISMCWTCKSLTGSLEQTTYSNQNGLFSLTNTRGKRLGIQIKKEGYYKVSGYENQTSFEYASPGEDIYHEPDEKKPIIFKMRKKGIPINLITGKVVLELVGQDASDGADFLISKHKNSPPTSPSGKNVPAGEGQMQVTTSRPVYTTEYQNTGGKIYPYDWSIDIKFPDGGFVETNEIFPFLAPASGYKSDYSQKSHIEDGWSKERDFRKQWYFRIGNPAQYGFMKISAEGTGEKVTIRYYLNPTLGDRNLEPNVNCDINLL